MAVIKGVVVVIVDEIKDGGAGLAEKVLCRAVGDGGGGDGSKEKGLSVPAVTDE